MVSSRHPFRLGRHIAAVSMMPGTSVAPVERVSRGQVQRLARLDSTDFLPSRMVVLLLIEILVRREGP